MASTRYKESRTVVRRLRRLREESPTDFRAKVLRLRRQCEQFSVNAAEICQWMMSFRPGGKNGNERTQKFWEFFLQPEESLRSVDEDNCDRIRRAAFDVATGLDAGDGLARMGLPESIVQAIRVVGQCPKTTTAIRMIQRLSQTETSHRQILLKASAEWIVAHYLRGFENWRSQREAWEKEKIAWERAHPELTESIREDFNRIFKGLNIKIKRPRLCTWARLKAERDDCDWAGERINAGGWKNHSPLCARFKKFLDTYPGQSGVGAKFRNFFAENARAYIQLRRGSRAPQDVTMHDFLRRNPKARWFPQAWKAYLVALNITEETALKGGPNLTHCVTFAPEADCQYNVHTNDCREYRKALVCRPDLQPIEELYREWRREFLSGPAKPCFQYPSQRSLPMPKIFGADYFRVNLADSLLELRLEGCGEDEFERFRFASWPADYTPSAKDAKITSVHVSFVGTRARVGFRFQVPHKRSRFAMGQDQIDILRRRDFPRRAQDSEFLEEARKRLLESFGGNRETEMRVLAVDLGTDGAAAAVFAGQRFEKAERLRVIKIDGLYPERPPADKGRNRVSSGEEPEKHGKGLGAAHVGRHLETWALGAKRIAEKRASTLEKQGTIEIAAHDMRRLSLHVRWMIRDWVRLNAFQIIEAAERNHVDLIVFESLRGFRLPGYDKLDNDKKRRLGFWAHGRIRQKVREKAVERGMRVVTVPYFKSSQFCAACGVEQEDTIKLKREKRARHHFTCEKCGHQGNSDENAARVLGRVFWGEINLPQK